MRRGAWTAPRAGIRTRFGFKVYAAGLYLMTRSTNPEMVYTATLKEALLGVTRAPTKLRDTTY